MAGRAPMNFWENKVLFIDGEAIVIDKPAGLAVHPGRADAARAWKTIFTIFVSDSSGCRCRSTGSTATRPAACCSPATPRRTRPSSARSRTRRSARPMSRCSTACRRRRRARSTWRSARSRPPRRAGGWCRIRAGKAAVTHWRVAAVRDGRAVVVFTPETGRTHQIRVHAAAGIGIADRRRSGLRRGARGRCCSTPCRCSVERDGKPPVEATRAAAADLRQCGASAMSFELPEEALEERFLAASGPGGQNVNKVATACQLAATSSGSASRRTSIAAEDAGRQPDDRGRRDRHHRPQIPHPGGQSRGCAGAAGGIDRQGPCQAGEARRTRPSRAAKAKRVDAKKQRGSVKQGRGKVTLD